MQGDDEIRNIVFTFNLKNYIWSGDGKQFKIYFGDNTISTKNIDN